MVTPTHLYCLICSGKTYVNYRAYALKLVYFQFIPIHMQYFISQSFSYSSNILPPKSFLHSDVTLDVL